MRLQAGKGLVAFPSLGSRGSASSERSMGRSESSAEGDEPPEPTGNSSSGGVTHSSSGDPYPSMSAATMPTAAAAAAVGLSHQRSPRKRVAASKSGGLGPRRGSADQSSCGGPRRSFSDAHPDWNEGAISAMPVLYTCLADCMKANTQYTGSGTYTKQRAVSAVYRGHAAVEVRSGI